MKRAERSVNNRGTHFGARVMKRPAAAGRGAGDREFDIVPGEPERSILAYRVESTEPGVMMPELGRHIGDPEAVELLAAWVASLH